ncbi:TPA: hypothetical protein ACRU53_000369 [Staphylococcus aureus]
MHDGSVFIAKIRFKRDTSPNIKPRQFIVISSDNGYLYFLETESVINKVKFNLSNIKRSSLKYHILTSEESLRCGFNVKTAVNCYELFYCEYFPEILSLKHRDLPIEILKDIQGKVRSIKEEELNIEDCKISKQELINLNPKLR